MKKHLQNIALLTFLSFMFCTPNSAQAEPETIPPRELSGKKLTHESQVFRATVEQIINNISDEQVQGQLNHIISTLNDIEVEIEQPGADLNEINKMLAEVASQFEEIILNSPEAKLLIAPSAVEDGTQ